MFVIRMKVEVKILYNLTLPVVVIFAALFLLAFQECLSQEDTTDSNPNTEKSACNGVVSILVVGEQPCIYVTSSATLDNFSIFYSR